MKTDFTKLDVDARLCMDQNEDLNMPSLRWSLSLLIQIWDWSGWLIDINMLSIVNNMEKLGRFPYHSICNSHREPPKLSNIKHTVPSQEGTTWEITLRYRCKLFNKKQTKLSQEGTIWETPLRLRCKSFNNRHTMLSQEAKTKETPCNVDMNRSSTIKQNNLMKVHHRRPPFDDDGYF